MQSNLSGYEQTTISAAFNTFFANPKWELKETPNGTQFVMFTGRAKKNTIIKEQVLVQFKFLILRQGENVSSFKIYSMTLGSSEDGIVYRMDSDPTMHNFGIPSVLRAIYVF